MKKEENSPKPSPIPTSTSIPTAVPSPVPTVIPSPVPTLTAIPTVIPSPAILPTKIPEKKGTLLPVQKSTPAKKETAAANKNDGNSITIRTLPPDGEIYINGDFKGNSPLLNLSISPGTYKIEIIKSGYKSYKGSITINKDKKDEIKIRLEECKKINISGFILLLAIGLFTGIFIFALIKKGRSNYNTKDSSLLFGDYIAVKEITRDSFFCVYKGKNRLTKEGAIIKVPLQHLSEDPSFIKHFQADLEIWKNLHHPNIVNIRDYGQEKKNVYVTTELLKVTTLEEIIGSNQKLTLKQIMEIIFQISLALSYAHAKNIIHGDLKPSNILITENGNVKVNNFSIYKDLYNYSLETIGFYKGQINYMPPEKLEKKPVDFRVDLFSLGIILYRLITGEFPYEGETPHMLLESQYYKEINSANSLKIDIPEHIKEIVFNLIQIDPYQRGKSTEQLMKLLKGIKDNL